MSERQLWTWLRPLLPRGRFSRVESGETAPGIPDVSYTLPEGHSGWLELKFDKNPRSLFPFNKPDAGLRRDQVIWIKDEVAMGGRVLIVSSFKEGVTFTSGRYAESFNQMSRKGIFERAEFVIKKPLRAPDRKTMWAQLGVILRREL